MSPLCPSCGGRGGRRHKAAIRRIYERVDIGSLGSITALVLTVPPYLRGLVASRDGLEKLFKAARRFVGLHWFSPSGGPAAASATLHLIGRDHDKANGEPERRRDLHPHLHVLLFGPRRRGRAVPYAALREAWANELSRAYSVDAHVPYDGGPASVNVFVRDIKKRLEFAEAVRYHTRPVEPSDLAAYDDAFLLNLKRLVVVELRRFQWTRLWGLGRCGGKGVAA
jgi:hypothetical protein